MDCRNGRSGHVTARGLEERYTEAGGWNLAHWQTLERGEPSMVLDKVVLANGQELLASDVMVPVDGSSRS